MGQEREEDQQSHGSTVSKNALGFNQLIRTAEDREVWKTSVSTSIILLPYDPEALKQKGKVSSYIAQYPGLGIAQSALHITSLTDLFNQTLFQLFWEASSHMLQLMREVCSYIYPPLVYSQVLIYTAEWNGAM